MHLGKVSCQHGLPQAHTGKSRLQMHKANGVDRVVVVTDGPEWVLDKTGPLVGKNTSSMSEGVNSATASLSLRHIAACSGVLLLGAIE